MNTDIIRTDHHRTHPCRRGFVCAFIVLGACGGAASTDDTATTPADDTGTEGDTVPFEIVVEGTNGAVEYCGKKPLDWSHSCDQEGLAVLFADDEKTFATLFTDNIKLDPPAIDFDGRLAILSYLLACPTVGTKLYMDRVALSGDTLLLDEVLAVEFDGGSMITPCPYFVVTIPDTVAFTDTEATLTKVKVDGNPWYE